MIALQSTRKNPLVNNIYYLQSQGFVNVSELGSVYHEWIIGIEGEIYLPFENEIEDENISIVEIPEKPEHNFAIWASDVEESKKIRHLFNAWGINVTFEQLLIENWYGVVNGCCDTIGSPKNALLYHLSDFDYEKWLKPVKDDIHLNPVSSLEGTFIKVIKKKEGPLAIQWFKEAGINTKDYKGMLNEEHGDIAIYYGIQNGKFLNRSKEYLPKNCRILQYYDGELKVIKSSAFEVPKTIPVKDLIELPTKNNEEWFW